MTTGQERLSDEQRSELAGLGQRLRLHLGKGGIFIVAADDPDVQRTVERHLVKAAGDAAWHSLDAGEEQDVLLAIVQTIRKGAADPTKTIFSVKTGRLTNAEWPRFFNSLNVRREYIPEEKITLVLWLKTDKLDDLARHAKDFWSFRASVHRFGA